MSPHEPVASEGFTAVRVDAARRNSLFNLLGAAVPMAVALATVPAYLDVAGATRYGVLTLAWLMLAYLGAANLGLGRALASQVARASAASDRTRIVWTGIAVNLAMGLAGALVVYGLGHLLFSQWLSLSSELRAQALDGLPWLALGVPFLLAVVACVGALEGVGSFALVNLVEGIMTVGYQVLPLAVAIVWGPNLTWLFAAAAAAPVTAAVVGFVACVLRMRLGRPRAERALIRPLLRLGGPLTVSSVVGPLLTVFDRFIVGAVLGARAVAIYSIPLNLVTRFAVLPASVTRAVFPTLVAATATEARALARQTLHVIATVMTPVVVAGLVLAEPFLELWIGESLAAESAPVAEIVLVSIWLNALAFPALTFLQARGGAGLAAKVHVIELVPYAVGLWIGLSVGGVEGAALAWTLRTGVDAGALIALSGLSAAREIRGFAPLLAVLAAFGVATLGDGSVVGVVLGAVLVVGTSAWAWRGRGRGPWRLVTLTPGRMAP